MSASVDEIARLMGGLAQPTVNLPAYPAIYPNTDAPVVRVVDGGRRLERVGWGLPPPGGKRRPVTNVRNLGSPFWRPLLSHPERRCLVPVTAFCEWTGERGSKRQVWFERADAPVFAFAGLVRDTDEGPRMAFLTCEPNPLVGAVHPKAMPVMLEEADHAEWLEADAIEHLARPFPAERMRVVE